MLIPQVNFRFGLFRLPALTAVLLMGLPWSALAQGSVNFQLRVQQGQNVFVVPNGSNLAFSASAIGQAQTATITAIYEGSTSAKITTQPVLLGSTDFTVSTLDALPLTLNPGDTFQLTLQFKPTAATARAAQLSVSFSELQFTSTGGVVQVAGTIQLNLTGTAPNLQVSYFLETNNNVLPVNSGGNIPFPPTLLTTTSVTDIVISNSGSGDGGVNSVTVTGSAFQPLGVPLVPFAVTAGNAIRFQISYKPQQVGTDTGSLAIDLGGIKFTATLTANGVNFQYSYQMVTALGSTPFTTAQPLSLPDTNVGSTFTATIKVQNTGTAAGIIAAVGVFSGPFAVSNLRTFPVILNPNDVLTFTLTFTPVQTGKATGTLVVGNDLFTLSGNGLGPGFTYSYGSSTTVQPSGMVIFSPLQVGQTSKLTFTVQNSGTVVGSIASIATADTSGVFRLENVPSLPTTLDPGSSIKFTIDFSPQTTGIKTSILQIDSQSFTLSGSGNPPPALPAVTFTGANGNVTPFSQPSVGLSLASPYPLDLTGTLTLSINSSTFTPDPSIQFVTGGPKVAFTIPANSTQAVFGVNGNQVALQSGTSASTIVLTATVGTATGLDLTPSPAPADSLTVPPSAPTLLAVQLSSSSATGLTLQVVGFSTSHTLSTLNFQFTTTSDVSATSGSVPVDVSSAASNWFASTQSQQFGGQFAITVPFVLSSSSTLTSILSKIQSVSVTAVNTQGTSNSVTTVISGP